jgi:hypothetical protein
VLALAGPVMAQAPRDRDSDLLDKARRAEAVAAQKVEAEVRDAVLDAQRLSATDRARAVARLKKAITFLEDDTVLSDSRRAALQRMLKDRIRVLEAGPAREDERPSKGARDDERRTAAEKKAADQAIISQQIDAIRELQRDGKFTEANRLAHELARKYPANPSVLALVRSTSSASQVADQRSTIRDKDRRVVGVYRDVDRSGMPPSGDIEFPKDWAEKTKRRLKSSTQLTAKEQAILTALNLPIAADFKESRFEDVKEYLETVMGQPIILDKSALDDVHVTYETPVTLRIRGKVAARTVLRTILSNLGLYYVIKEEVIMITTAEKARVDDDHQDLSHRRPGGPRSARLAAGRRRPQPGRDDAERENDHRHDHLVRRSAELAGQWRCRHGFLQPRDHVPGRQAERRGPQHARRPDALKPAAVRGQPIGC